MCLLGKEKGLHLERRMIRCPDQFQARRYLGLRRVERRLDHGFESAEEGEQNCLYAVRTYSARSEVRKHGDSFSLTYYSNILILEEDRMISLTPY